MATYNPSRDNITVLGGRVISVSNAEHLIHSLESAIETAKEYRESPELHDIGLNEMALSHLLNPTEKDYPMKVCVSYDIDEADIARDYLSMVIDENDQYGALDALIDAPDIRTFFDESDGITGFRVEIPDSDDFP